MFKIIIPLSSVGLMVGSGAWAQAPLPSQSPLPSESAVREYRAEDGHVIDHQVLPTVSVSAPRLARELYATPAAVSTVERESIARGQQRVRLDESLTGVPGVYLQNRDNFAQGQRIAIRGFGSRAAFGVRGITVRVDGIPYTLPDGQAQLDAIDLESAERIEVIRGPAAVAYGNAAGGVIDITTARGDEAQGWYARASGGSDGYRKASLRHGGSVGDWSHHISVSALGVDGYRERSSTEKYLLNANVRRELGSARALTLMLNLLENPRSQDPGALTLAEVSRGRDQAAPNALALDAGQRVDQQLVGLHYEDLAAGPGELHVRGFYSQRDFEQQLPYVGDSRLGYQRDYYGGSVEYRQSFETLPIPLSYVAGIDAARQEDDRFRRRVSAQGAVGETLVTERQTATSLGLFWQGDAELTEQWLLSLGARFDRVALDTDDRLRREGDASGERTFTEWSGSLGLSYRYLPEHQVYLNTGTAFETPTFTEFANPAGAGFNPGIEPQKAWNRELGMRGYLASQALEYDVVLFSVDVRDELVPFEQGGRTFYENAGDTSRDGVELALGWQWADAWRWDTALTLARYRFDRFETPAESVDGNRLPGLPARTWNNQLTWQSGERFATVEAQYVGSQVADNANEVGVDSHWLVNLRAGDGWALGGNTSLNVFAGVRNLFDREYYDNLRINANFGRYYEPAPGRTFYAGIETRF